MERYIKSKMKDTGMESDARKTKIGILTDTKRKYLRERGEREIKGAPGPTDEREINKQKQYDKQITLDTEQALKDLALIAWAYGDTKTKKLFPVRDMQLFLRSLISKVGSKDTDRGIFYQVLIHEIVAAMNGNSIRDHRTRLSCNISAEPLASIPMGSVGMPDIEPGDKARPGIDRNDKEFLKELGIK